MQRDGKENTKKWKGNESGGEKNKKKCVRKKENAK